MGAVPAAARVTRPVSSQPSTGLQMIAIARLKPSPTNPRRHFAEEQLKELAESIRADGVLQPILVRKITKPLDKKGSLSVAVELMGYEIICGERRFRASQLAGLSEIPACVIEASDREVLEKQITENEQRSDVTDLERSDAYHRLIHEHKLSVSQVSQQVGKSEATIRSLLKLQDLPGVARNALEAGSINSAVAQLVATRPSQKMREQVAKYALKEQEGWDPDEQQRMKGLPSYRNVKEFVRRELMVPLDQAPFDLAKRVGAHPDCETCTHRTGNNRADFPDGRPDVCTLPTCFSEKKETWQKAQVESAKRLGQKVLSAAEAKKVLPHRGLAYDADYFDLASKCYELKNRSYDDLLRKHLDPKEIVLGFDQFGDLHHLVPKKIANRILKEKHKLGVKKSENREPTAAEMKEKEEIRKRKLKAQGRHLAAIEAIRRVGDEAKQLGSTLGWNPVLTGMLRELVATMTSVIGSLGLEALAEARGIDDEDAADRLEASVRSMTTARDLFTYFAQFLAADVSESWKFEYSQGPNEDEQKFFATFNVDARKLCKQYEASTASAKAKASPKEKKSRPAKVEFDVSDDDADEANAECSRIDNIERVSVTFAQANVSKADVERSSIVHLFADKVFGKSITIVRPFSYADRLWVHVYVSALAWACLPLLTVEEFEAEYPDQAITLRPTHQLTPQTIYFGVRVSAENTEYVIGPLDRGIYLVEGK